MDIELVELGGNIKLEMVLVPKGKFLMGSPELEEGRSEYEVQRRIILTKDFFVGKYAVTQEQWQILMGNNPSKNKGVNFPVTNVSWDDCKVFLKKLKAKTGKNYRLLTEAEWEYSCRSGTITPYFFGENVTQNKANFDLGNIVAVGSYKPNSFGLYDMHGNIWEWCEDWFAVYDIDDNVDPINTSEGDQRVLRGGSFYGYVAMLRSSSRGLSPQASQSEFAGFRLARTK
jgi:formylglycine-generating enzyme required for sulfatase activity